MLAPNSATCSTKTGDLLPTRSMSETFADLLPITSSWDMSPEETRGAFKKTTYFRDVSCDHSVEGLTDDDCDSRSKAGMHMQDGRTLYHVSQVPTYGTETSETLSLTTPINCSGTGARCRAHQSHCVSWSRQKPTCQTDKAYPFTVRVSIQCCCRMFWYHVELFVL